MVVRDPVTRVCEACEARREEIAGAGWNLADVYRELGGGRPGTSGLHAQFEEFFNGQAREILDEGERAKLGYWAGVPERGAALRDLAIGRLAEDQVRMGNPTPPSAGMTSGSALDAETRALILAHNQIDLELHSHFAATPPVGPAHPAQAEAARVALGEAVCVLGAPRSGTSLTARVLNILGVDLGSERDLMPPAAANNRAGFWEHEALANLNEEILATLSSSPPPYLQAWRWPPELSPGWENDPALDPHREAAAKILAGSFTGSRRWGWKDPRNSLTLRFWRRLVPDMRYAICVRHPLDVAASLAARDQMGTEESLRLWTRYMTDALEATTGSARIVVAYEAYFSDWEAQTRRLAAFLGLERVESSQSEAVAAHIEGALRHHRRSEQGVSTLSIEVAELYAELMRLAQA